MHRVWIICLLGCGYPPLENASPTDGSTDVMPDISTSLTQICSSINAPNAPQFHAAACATPTMTSIRLSASASIHTGSGASEPPGLTCVVVNDTTQTDAKVCVIVAPTIIVDAGVTLSAHGPYPLALFAHAITINGTIDVASHIVGGAVGPASLQGGCSAGTFPREAGGGRGGHYAELGGRGGDEGAAPSTGGTGGGTFLVDTLIGGCGGTRGGDGNTGGGSDGGTATGGAGGGVVWIVSDTAQLELNSGAVINASGASGAGGARGGGGAGGGAGGLIVLQSPGIKLDPNAAVFANGGHGGGGGGANPSGTPGSAGIDSMGPASMGGGGGGGGDLPFTGLAGSGDGAPGYPATGVTRNGLPGSTAGHGGGGAGGAPGGIRLVTTGTFTPGPNMSPPPVILQ